MPGIVQRLENYCLSKPGAEFTDTFGSDKPTYRVLGGFLLHFATFYLNEVPNVLLLRCEKSRLMGLSQQYTGIVKSPRMKWGDDKTWTWIEIALIDDIPESQIQTLIDNSYILLLNELNPHQKRMIDFGEESFDTLTMLKRLAEVHDLSHRIEQILQLPQPSIALRTKPTSPFYIGQSKIGGLPDLPKGWEWSRFDDKPLSFLAQINLSKIQIDDNPLPKKGILYFFSAWGWIDEQSSFTIPWDASPSPWQQSTFSTVLYFDGGLSQLETAKAPQGIHVYKAASVEFSQTLTMPRAADYVREDAVVNLKWSEDEYQRLDKLYFDLLRLHRRAMNYPPNHQLLGFPMPIQSSLTSGDKRLLFQLDCDSITNMEWADGGMIYFTMRHEDLINHNFSKVKSMLDSG